MTDSEILEEINLLEELVNSMDEALRDLELRSQWIDCNEQIPTLGSYVLVSNPGCPVKFASLRKRSLTPTRTPELCWHVAGESIQICPYASFTHWKQLPAPPKDPSD